MNKQHAAAVALALTLSAPAVGPAPWTAQGPAPWQLINYYGGDDLSWWETTLVDALIGVACGLIGTGVGTVTGPGGYIFTIACDAGLGA